MIRVMIVDDSPLARKIATDILVKDPEIEVVATASNAEFALGKMKKLRPDVITMDIEMPGMGGLTAIREIMRIQPTPIVVLSALAKRGAELTMQALELGAVDFIPKPTVSLSGGIDNVASELIEKVKHASKIKVDMTKENKEISGSLFENKVNPSATVNELHYTATNDFEIVAIGTSTGGPVALKTVLTKLPENFPVGIVIVQHMPPVFTEAFANRLNSLCKIKVKEAEDGDLIEPGKALLSPGDFHMTVTRYNTRPKVMLHKWEPVSGHRPSVDVLMHSVMREYGRKAIGVIMTGMGKDGAEGLHELRQKGGYIIAQDRETSAIFGMNGEVIKNGDANEVIPVYDIASRLIYHTMNKSKTYEKSA